jgi:hypothetical protein
MDEISERIAIGGGLIILGLIIAITVKLAML